MKKVLRLIAAMIYLIVFVLISMELMVRGYWEATFLLWAFQVPILATISGEDL